MTELTPNISLIFAAAIFASVVFLHLTKKDSSAVQLYMAQSSIIATLLILSLVEKFSILMLIAIIATFTVKIIVAPYFFFSLIKRLNLKLSANTYLNTPTTLLVIAILAALTRTDFLKPLTYLTPLGPNLLYISMATILVSLFLSINKKGAVSQTLSFLSLENGIVAFALFAGLEQNPALQIGITFNIFVWITIATVFTSMVFRQFGSLDVSNMKKLTE